MIQIRRSDERGHFNYGWLDTYHTFSFAEYHAPAWMGYRALRVINEDRVEPGQGFGTHAHRDMEILTYILEGELEHKDSMGNGSIIRPGRIQRMTAGTGVTHSEFNPSAKSPVHLLQIWVLPEKKGLKPGYEERELDPANFQNKLGRVYPIRKGAELLAARLAKGKVVEYVLKPGRFAWAQVARGTVLLNGAELASGDGAAVSDEKKLIFEAQSDAEVLLFDLE
jgi:hypothetical protein